MKPKVAVVNIIILAVCYSYIKWCWWNDDSVSLMDLFSECGKILLNAGLVYVVKRDHWLCFDPFCHIFLLDLL